MWLHLRAALEVMELPFGHRGRSQSLGQPLDSPPDSGLGTWGVAQPGDPNPPLSLAAKS